MSKIITAPGSITRLKHNLAFVEESNVATNNIKKDQYVIWKDMACRALSNISIGDTLSSSNLSMISNDGLINDSITNNDYSSSGLTPSNCTIVLGGYHKIGKFVVINMRINKSAASGVSISGFPRPAIADSYAAVSVFGYDSSNEKAAFAYISQYGSLNFPSSYSDTGNIILNCTYMCQ